jgi:RNase P subunit RPR2
MNNAREYEEESPAQAERYDISITELSDTKIHVMAQEEVNELMRKAREYTWTVDHAREYEKDAQDMAKKYNLSIPKLSDDEIRTKAQEEINHIMVIAGDDWFDVDMAIYCEKKAQAVAKKYKLPIPKLTRNELQIKAKWQIQDHMMRACQYAVTVKEARKYEKAAQAMAKKYKLSIPKFSDIDIDIIKQREKAEE